MLRAVIVGNFHCYWPSQDGVPTLFVPQDEKLLHRTMLLFFANSALHFAFFVCLITLLNDEYEWYVILAGCVLVTVSYGAYVRTHLGDPGIPHELLARATEDSPAYCLADSPEATGDTNSNDPCHSEKNHCDICGICVEDRERHCSVYNKCIGRGNRTAFKLSFWLPLINLAYFLVVFGLVTFKSGL